MLVKLTYHSRQESVWANLDNVTYVEVISNQNGDRVKLHFTNGQYIEVREHPDHLQELERVASGRPFRGASQPME